MQNACTASTRRYRSILTLGVVSKDEPWAWIFPVSIALLFAYVASSWQR